MGLAAMLGSFPTLCRMHGKPRGWQRLTQSVEQGKLGHPPPQRKYKGRLQNKAFVHLLIKCELHPFAGGRSNPVRSSAKLEAEGPLASSSSTDVAS